jgi:hypothetical protein
VPGNLEAVLIVIVFIIPGVISQRVLGAAISRQQRETQDVLLEAVLFSCVNFAAFGWLLIVVPDLSTEWATRHRTFVISAWVLFLLVAPVIWGWIFALAIERDWLTGLYGWFGLRYRDPTPRAWDYYFGQRRQAWVRVRLVDGSVIAGYMGPRSFASSFPSPEDLYLETVYPVDEDGRLGRDPLPESGGVWIQGSQIKAIEFITAPTEGAERERSRSNTPG